MCCCYCSSSCCHLDLLDEVGMARLKLNGRSNVTFRCWGVRATGGGWAGQGGGGTVTELRLGNIAWWFGEWRNRNEEAMFP